MAVDGDQIALASLSTWVRSDGPMRRIVPP